MCGICGVVNHNGNPVKEMVLQTMMKRMKHRGPDDEGTFTDGSFGLGFVRLSIIDLSKSGHQPMVSSSGHYIMVFNGEIFNYIELRNDLQSKGYQFHTRTDSEVLLNAYIEWGENCLDKFNGMWAFAIYDKKNRELFAARDRYGIKPFYYYRDQDQFVFASEIPSLLSALKNKAQPDNQVVFDYLVFNRTDQGESTFFDGIKKLQHGHKLKIKDQNMIIEPWYVLKERIKSPFADPEEFLDTFVSSVELRLRSDVPVGVCLSGGLDSSSIVSVITDKFGKKDLHTFSAVYGKGNFGDESDFISEYKLNNMHYITPDAKSVFADMNALVRAHGEPIPSTSPYAQFKVMELAKNHVVVTLDGQGADEVLAGYYYFFGLFFKGLLRKGKIWNLQREMLAYYKIHHSLFGIYTFMYFLMPSFLRTSLRVREKGYVNNEFKNTYAGSNNVSGNIYGSSSLHDALLDHFEYKLEHLLKWEDRNSMWFSLESRVPFLDFRLVERALSLPENMVIFNGMTKHILRESMKGILPEKIRIRTDKVGFGTPQDEWFREDHFRTYITDLIHSDSFRKRNIIQPEKAEKLYNEHLSGRKNIAKEIWKWINLELWFREFIDQSFVDDTIKDSIIKINVREQN